jgi:organic hydroperoxide reductase OsmC/OhrA
MNAVAPSLGVRMPTNPEDSVIDTTVHLVDDMKKLDMGMRLDMKASIRGLHQDQIDKIVGKAKEACPYSCAMRGIITTIIEAVQS